MKPSDLRPALPSAIVLFVLVAGSMARGEAPDSIEFFENRIRPVLVERCYECHSSESDEIGGALKLDSRDGMMVGGDSGPAIDPGNVQQSMLISAIRYESSEMPPDGKLSDQVIQDFEQWISAGAVDPRNDPGLQPLASGVYPSGVDLDAGRNFWAFQPLASSQPSGLSASGSTTSGVKGAIDGFLNDRLGDAGITPNPMADPLVQLRRLAFDLTGLPPSLEMQQWWLADPSPKAWLRLVDRMLASPEFGEHWARHWMDVARYADSNGSDFNATHHEAWRYRDYLIRSFAGDRPIDQMIREQVAGDLLPFSHDQQRYDNLVATTFLMLGTKMLSERDKDKLVMDVVDEQIDTVGRAFLGLTLGCARCHDHKFDPVPTEDYYALAGIFKSTVTLKGESQKYVSTWNRVPLPTSDQHRREVESHASAVKSLEAEIKRAEKELQALQKGEPTKLGGIVVDDEQAEKKGSWKSSVYFKHFVGDGYVHDDNAAKGEVSIRFAARLPKTGQYEVRISHSPGSNRASAVPVTIRTVDGDVTVTVDQRSVQIEPMWTSLGVFELAGDEDTVVVITNQGTNGYVIADAVQFLPHDGLEAKADSSPNPERVEQAQASLDDLKKRLDQVKAAAPPSLPEAMAPLDHTSDKIADSPVHIRGEVKNHGPVVPRGFLQVLSPGVSSIRSPQGSGRAELADWLTDPDNPLVARVFVNRVWMHLMGEGLVRTVDNFGVQGERPSHPELLDHLAIQFVRGGWHLKSTVREIVNPDAYRRGSEFHSDSIAADPENRLLWRMHRRRLPAESIRDAMLVASGQLDPRSRSEPMTGRGVLVSSNSSDSNASFEDVASPCRSIYLPIVRGYLPALMTSLDMADPDLIVGRRPTTNVPAQALVLINSPEINDWARQTAERITRQASDFEQRLQLTYKIVLQRGASPRELRTAREYFAGHESSLDAWHQLVAALFAGTPFRLLD